MILNIWMKPKGVPSWDDYVVPVGPVTSEKHETNHKIVEKAGMTLDSGYFFGKVVEWFILVAFLVAAFDVLGLKQVTTFLSDVVLGYLPQVMVAALIILIAAVVAETAQKIVVGAAKAAGNYSAQFYPTKLANEKGFQQVIWTDDATHTKLEESGTMNVFFRINDTLYTAPTSERILDGVTRKSLIAIAERDGIELSVRSVFVAELIEAEKNGSLKEIFGAGTAAVVTVIKGFSYQDEYYELTPVDHSFALDLKNKITAIQHKLAEDTFGWTLKV
jgi:branched-subunit amino acid aminotransferase/4-amino-4-deoxychorismate lyase